MTTLELTNRRNATHAYDAAARDFDAPQLSFWNRHGCRTVALLELKSPDHVLDVGCGTGASAIPAARLVGPKGRVTGIDVAPAMLDRARSKARTLGLRNVRFEQADMTCSGLPDAGFDAVVSVFSLFFVDDMHGQIAELWRMLRPGGQLAITVWGPEAFQPCARIFEEELGRLRPDLPVGNRPWHRLASENRLRALIKEATGCNARICHKPDQQPLDGPDDWWSVMLGSGYRWYIEQLTPEERPRARGVLRKRLHDDGIEAFDTSIITAIVSKPHPTASLPGR